MKTSITCNEELYLKFRSIAHKKHPRGLFISQKAYDECLRLYIKEYEHK